VILAVVRITGYIQQRSETDPLPFHFAVVTTNVDRFVKYLEIRTQHTGIELICNAAVITYILLLHYLGRQVHCIGLTITLTTKIDTENRSKFVATTAE